MHKIKSVFLSLLLAFSISPSAFAYTGEAAFKPLVKAFIEEARLQGREIQTGRLSMNFGTTEGNVIGLCWSGGSITPAIVISRKFWDESPETSRRLVVFHELGHCTLNRRHREDQFTNGNPMSIMYPIILADQIFLRFQTYYLRELFEFQGTADDEFHVDVN